MRWVRFKEAYTTLGITEGKLKYLVEKGDIKRHKNQDGYYRYGIPSEEKETFFVETPDYIYDPASELYVFNDLPGQKSSVTVPRQRIDNLIWDYSNSTGGLTLNEICRKYALTRPTVRSILKSLGVTHDSAPFSDQTIEEETEEDLVESLVRAKEQRVIVKAQRKRYRAIQEKAELLEKFDLIFLNQLVDKLKDAPPLPVIQFDRIPPATQSRHLTVIGLTDLHVGKLTVKREDRMDAMRDRSIQTVKEAVKRSIMLWGIPDRWVIPCGSDLIHVDTYLKTTTKGTAQDSEDPLDILIEAYAVMQQIIETLSQHAPVTVITISGNHDRILGLSVGMMLKARYYNDPNIEVDLAQTDYAYLRYGNSLLGFHHGDGVKNEELPRLMSRDRAKDWGACEGGWEWFTGHLHHFNSKEYYGCRVWTMPALCGSDKWHRHRGYTGSKRQLALYRVAPKGGVQGVELVDLTD